MESDGEFDYESLIAAQNRKKKSSGGFQSMGFDDCIFRGIKRKGYRVPTPIQRKTIPLVLSGKDVVAMARTGSGKTAAFLLPMLQKLKLHKPQPGARALLISPTRELALQTCKFLKELGKYSDLRTAVLIGGESLDDQFAALHEQPDVIVATPGRLLHVAVEMNLKLKSVEYIVFDEADRLFELGFEEQLRDVLRRLPKTRQTLLFSATLPRVLVDFAKAGLSDPVLVRLDVDAKISDKLQTSYIYCRSEDKLPLLLFLLINVISRDEQAIIFCATKHHVEYLRELLTAFDVACAYLYSSLDADARKINVARFRDRKVGVLLVTDIAARGVDLPLLDVAINLHFPPQAKLFVHRVGRVARAGRSGKAISLLSCEELPYLIDLYLFLGRPLHFARKEDTMDKTCLNDAVFGVPQRCVDDKAELIREAHERSADLISLRHCAENAYRKYVKSRPAASAESIKRAKQLYSLNQLVFHPDLHACSDTLDARLEEERSAILTSLRNYRPHVTIFELNVSSKNEPYVIMKAKRRLHNKYVELTKQKQQSKDADATEKPSSHTKTAVAATEEELHDAFSTCLRPVISKKPVDGMRKKMKKPKAPPNKDANFFVPYRPVDFYSEKELAVEKSSFGVIASSSVVDFTTDDTNGMQKQNKIVKWDRKRKRYVNESGKEQMKKFRTESGVLVPASYKTDLYSKWKKKFKIDEREQMQDGEEHDVDSTSGSKPRFLGKTSWKGQRKGQRTAADTATSTNRNAHRRRNTELKSKEQIVKQRKRKARIQAYQKHRHTENLQRRAKTKANKRSN